MNRYELDYRQCAPAQRTGSSGARRTRAQGRELLRQLGAWLGLPALLLLGISEVSQLRLRAENRSLQAVKDKHHLRYDSLLAAKLEADRRLHHLQVRLQQPTSNAVLTRP